ncbi:MAG TPA: hypothetical protein VFG90_08840 [Nitrososphaeraceae archaeon]|nr:hypothetical protein [Nitrososphaeraceae archaeon]
MEGKPGNKITNYLTKFYMKYTSTISLNKNLLLSGSVGFIVSLIVAYVSTKYSNDDFVTSALTVIAGLISSKVIFVILFHLDNKKKYTIKLTGKLNFDILKQIVTKMIFADAIFDIINNVSRFFILLELLRIEYHPVQAAIIASIIASCFSYLAINLIVRRIHVFRFRKKLF